MAAKFENARSMSSILMEIVSLAAEANNNDKLFITSPRHAILVSYRAKL